MRLHATITLCVLSLLCSSGCSAPAARSFEEIDYRMGPERDVVVDGVRLRVREGGPAGAPTVLLLHCFGLTMEVWRDLVPLLEQRYHVVAYDAYGHGKSARGVRRPRLRELARTGVRLLDVLGIERAILIGNSMGGGTALHMALAAPERVTALVLVDSVGLADDEWFIPLWPFVGPRHVQSGAHWTWDLAYTLAVQRRSPLAEEVREHVLATRADAALAPLTAHAMYGVVADIFATDLLHDLRYIQAPTLVVAGRHDRLVSVGHAERLARGIEGARLHVIEPLGHLPELEDAALLASVALPFIDDVTKERAER